jgi:general secretion pathway protein K
VDEPSRLAFTRLFELLNLPVSELAAMTENLRLLQGASAQAPSNLALPLVPQELDQLTWTGLSPRTLASLRPYVTLLPVRTPVNLNTAAPEVIYASVEAFEMADASRFVRARELTHLMALSDAVKIAGNAGVRFTETEHSIATRFFEVRGILQVEQTIVQEQSVVQRDGMEVKTLGRKRGVLTPGAPLQ